MAYQLITFFYFLVAAKMILTAREREILGKIPIGAIFDFDDKESKAGFLFAIAQFNNDKMEQFKLSSTMHQINVKDSYNLATSICEQMSSGVFMLFGARRIESSSIVQSYTQTFHVPFVSPSPAENVEPVYPSYQLHMRPKHTRALVDLIKHFHWKNFHYVYDSEEGLYSLQSILRGLEGKKHDVQVRMRRLADINNAHEDLRALDKLDENATNKYILLDLSKEVYYSAILKQIREVGMNKEGYHYILGTLDFMNLDMERYQHGGVNITGFQLVNYTSAVVEEFFTLWSTLDPNVWTGASNSSIHIDAALSVDGITVIHKTLSALIMNYTSIFKHTFRRGLVFNNNRTRGVPCDTNPPEPWMHGESLMEGMRELRFKGLTGNVQFDRYGFRKNYRFGIYNVGLKTGPNKIGEWGPKGIEYTDGEEVKPEMNDSTTEKVYIVTSVEPHYTYVRLFGDDQEEFEYAGTWNLRRHKPDVKLPRYGIRTEPERRQPLSTPRPFPSYKPPSTSTRKYLTSNRPIKSVLGITTSFRRGHHEDDYKNDEENGMRDVIGNYDVNDRDDVHIGSSTTVSAANDHIESSGVSSYGVKGETSNSNTIRCHLSYQMFIIMVFFFVNAVKL